MGVPLYFIHFRLGFSLTIQLLGYPHVRKPLYLWISYIYCYYCFYSYYYWLVVLTILKNVSQWEGWHPIYDMEKNVPDHQPVFVDASQITSVVMLWCAICAIYIVYGICIHYYFGCPIYGLPNIHTSRILSSTESLGSGLTFGLRFSWGWWWWAASPDFSSDVNGIWLKL